MGPDQGETQIEWDSAAGFNLGCASDDVGCQLPNIGKQAYGRVRERSLRRHSLSNLLRVGRRDHSPRGCDQIRHVVASNGSAVRKLSRRKIGEKGGTINILAVRAELIWREHTNTSDADRIEAIVEGRAPATSELGDVSTSWNRCEIAYGLDPAASAPPRILACAE